MNDVNPLNVVALMAVGLVAVGARRLRGNWLAPSACTPLLWFIFLALPLLGAPDYPVDPLSVWRIVLLLLIATFGAFYAEGVTTWSHRPGRSVFSSNSLDKALTRRLLSISAICSIAAVIGMVDLAYLSLGSYGLETSIDGLVGLGPYLSAERYVQGISYPTLVRALLIWIYPAALLAGLSYPSLSTRRERGIALAPFAVALALAVITAVRSGLLFTGVCWATGYLAVKICETGGRHSVFRAGILLRASVIAAAIVCFAIAIQMLRAGLGQADDFATTWSHIRSGAFGYLAAFSEWDRQGPDGISYGFFSFGGAFEILGFRTREIGMYLGSVTLPDGRTNVYTVFRGLIEDFTYPGATAAALIFGLVAGGAYRKASRGHVRSVVVLAGYYAACIWSPLASFFVYNGLVLAWICATGAVWCPPLKLVASEPGQMPAGARMTRRSALVDSHVGDR